MNRLQTASDTVGWSRTFNYDPYGNGWVTNTGNAPLAGNTPTTNVFDGSNRIGGGAYDPAGNQLLVNGETLRYDGENRQISATDPASAGGATMAYYYDGLGQRVAKGGPGGTTVYAYDAFGRTAGEYATNAPATLPCTTCYLSYDYLGSLRMVTDQNGAVVSRHEYLPFGEENTWGRGAGWGATADSVNQKFTGQERDKETGLDFLHARYYGAALGRFTSPDPANAGADLYNPQSWNGYSYVANNPLVNVDPTGESFLSIFKAIAGAIAVVASALSGFGVPFAGTVAMWAGLASGGSNLGGIIANHSVPSAVAAPLSEQIPVPPSISNPGQFVNDVKPTGMPDIDLRFWNFYLNDHQTNWLNAFGLLDNFCTGGGTTNRTYHTNDAQSQDLMNSGGFQTAIRTACGSRASSGQFNVDTWEAAHNLSHDALYSPTGVQVGGYRGRYTFKGPTMQITISNDAGAHSFFEHMVPNSPFSSGPLRTINQRFELTLSHACGYSRQVMSIRRFPPLKGDTNR